MTEQIHITEALKLWLCDQFTENDINIYNKQKKNNCYDLFHFNGSFLGGPKYIDFNNDLINKQFILSIVEKYKNKKGNRKIKNIMFEGDIEDIEDENTNVHIIPSNFNDNLHIIFTVDKNN